MTSSRRWTRREVLAAPALLRGQSARPNVLWLMTDEQRPDSMGCYRSPWARTPQLDALAQEGTVFESAYVPSPVCVPCRSAIITGNTASTIRVLHNQARLQPGATPLTWRFEDAGYQTATFGKKHYFLPGKRPAFQVEAGLTTDEYVSPESYGAAFHPARFDALQYRSRPEQKEQRRWILAGKFPVNQDLSAEARNVSQAMQWLDGRDRGKPFFLRVSFNAPHTPAVVPEQYLPLIDPARIELPVPSEPDLAGQPRRESELLRGFQGTQRLTPAEIRKMRHYYYARVSFADAMFGRLLDWMNDRRLLENTIVAFVSDHGAHLGDQGMVQKMTFYEQVATVPYFFWAPGLVKRGVRLRRPVNVLGLLPTLLELAGLPAGGCEAAAHADEVRNGREAGAGPVFSEMAFGYQGYRDHDRQVMVREGQFKLTLFPDGGEPDGALYDLEKDPGERQNLFHRSGHQNRIDKMKSLIEAWDRKRGYRA